MNAVEIEEAVSKLVEEPFNAAEFPYVFLEAFGNKTATLQRLRNVGKNSTNKTDVTGEGVQSVLQRNNIHMATCFGGGPDAVAELLNRLTDSPATSKHKAKFALATDGHTVHAESLNSDDPPLVCEYKELADHFGYFLELAGISTVRQIRENAFDIKATGRLNRLYIELLRNNPDWDGDQRREELNHFFARLIFCFFAEDTGIFNGSALFTETVRQMSDPSGENTDFVLSEIFRAMDVPMKERDAAKLRSWAGQFPHVNGGLFGNANKESGSPRPGGDGSRNHLVVPKFTQIARSYLLHIGTLDWTQINPDIFGSMIQAVADDEERGALGMHYTSVPNILKVLNPLFLDALHAQLKEAGSNPRKLLNLRKRLARIRVFDPACGSGNFLVIAYKEMRKIEAEINILRGEPERASEIPLAELVEMNFGNMPNDGGYLLLTAEEARDAIANDQVPANMVRPFLGSYECINGVERRCLWMEQLPESSASTEWLKSRLEGVATGRAASTRPTARALASKPYRFGEVRQRGNETVIIVPSVSSESREYLPVGFCLPATIVSNLAYALFNAPLWNLAIVASKLHLAWVATVCGKLETRLRYSNTLGWNTFPVPPLTDENKADLTRCAENILLAREAHWPATIAELYDPANMPDDLRAAHDRNDETLERIYIGRRFKNDTERLETLFQMYSSMKN